MQQPLMVRFFPDQNDSPRKKPVAQVRFWWCQVVENHKRSDKGACFLNPTFQQIGVKNLKIQKKHTKVLANC